MKDGGMKDDGMTDLRKARESQQEAGGMFRRGAEMVTRIFFCCLFFPVLIAFICFQGFLWFGVWVGVFWFVFLFGAFILFIWRGGQWCEEKVAGTRALLFLVIFFFLPFIASIIIALFPPDPLPAAHITALLNVKITGPAFAAILGFLLFAQRLDVMKKQTDLAQDQFALAQRQHESLQHQIEATQRRHEYEQFNRACELLGEEKTSTRMSGITTLRTLTRTNPEAWHIRIVNLLANFIRERSMNDDKSPVKAFLNFFQAKEKDEKEAEAKWQSLYGLTLSATPADIEEAMGVIACDLTDVQKTVVQKHLKLNQHWPDLRASWLCFIDLSKAYLPRALLADSFLYGTDLTEANLTDATLLFSHLNRTKLNGAILQNTQFSRGDLTGTNFEGATGLKEKKLSGCYYIKGKKPPTLPAGIKEPEPISITEYWEKARRSLEEKTLFVFQTFYK